MKKYLLSAAALLFYGYTAVAQQNEKNADVRAKREMKKSKDNKLNEYDEIVIKRKDPGRDTRVTIEIKGDEVIVDGKPIDDFSDEGISVQKRDINRYRLNNPRSAFRFEDGDWSADDFKLMNDGEGKAFLGVMTEGTAEGARITGVSEKSAAAKAGLKKDDIITKVNDKAVSDPEELSNVISELKPEDKVNITYKRDGKQNSINVILGKRRNDMMGGMPHVAPVPPMVFNFDEGEMGDVFRLHNARPRLGLKVQDTEDGKGVKVLAVDEGSAAEKAGIRENDIITSYEGKEISSAGELAKASHEAKDKASMKVQLNRNGKQQIIEIKVPKKLRTANL